MYERSRVNVKVNFLAQLSRLPVAFHTLPLFQLRAFARKIFRKILEIFSLHVVFPFNITCKTNSRLEVDAYCFEFLARAMIKNFEPSAAYSLKLQRTTGN